MKIHIIITTFNRSGMLAELLSDISREVNNYESSISVYDDGSDQSHSISTVSLTRSLRFDYYRAALNNGKKKYFHLINKAFAEIPYAEYYFMLPDDMRLCENYFKRTIELYEAIPKPDKICMNTDIDGRIGQECWTAYKPLDIGNYYRSQWFDMCGIMPRRFFTEVGNIRVGDRWAYDETLGSGVGSVISRNLNAKNFGMYHCKEQLTFHGDHESKMNPLQQKQKHDSILH